MWHRPDESLRWDVLEEHLDEACFLWTQWEAGLCSPRFIPAELAEGGESRLRAHLKALASGGSRVAAKLLIPALGEEDPERLRAASYVLLMDGEHVDTVLRFFTEAPKDLRWPFARALSLSERPGLTKHLLPLLAAEEPELLATTVEVLAFRRGLPLEVLSRLCRHEVPRVQAAALRAARTSGLPKDALLLREILASPHAPVRAAGLEWGLSRNMREALSACAQWVDAPDDSGRLSRQVLAMSGEPGHLERLLGLLDVPSLRAEALWALGLSGRLAAAEACLPWLRDAKLAGLAAEAFCGITGLMLAGAFRKDREEARDDEDAPGADDASPASSATLEQPVPEALERWWAEARSRFRKEQRYVAGKAFGAEALLDALASSVTRRRHVLALELAIRTQGQHVVETRDFSHFQARQVAAARSSSGGTLWTGPFSARMSH